MTKQEHLVAIVAEEGVETAQCCTKILRFGLREIQPGHTLSNLARLYQEYHDLVGAMWMLMTSVPGFQEDAERELGMTAGQLIDAKCEKISRFLEYSRSQGTLEG